MNFEIASTIVWIWIALGIVVFLLLFFLKIKPAYGRHSKNSWGPMINNSWGWAIMEIPSLLFLWISFLSNRTEETADILYLPIALWSLHYINRSFIFPFRLKNKKKKIPIVIVLSAIFFNVLNSYLNGLFLAKGWVYLSSFTLILGTVLFTIGMFVNLKSDHLLINLRKKGETVYRIPKGFLFDKISSPNFLGEMIEWLGYFILVPSLASFRFWLWTMANLLPRARDHHQWYKEQFEEYPKDRKVIFPWIY